MESTYTKKTGYLATEDGAHLYYQSQGSGPVILLIHGVLSNGHYWDQNIKTLSQQFQVVTIDLRGHGASMDSGPYSLEQCARDIDALIKELTLKEVTLVGWSMGAFVTYRYLELFGSDAVAGVCTVDIPPKMNNDESWNYGAFPQEEFPKTIAAIKAGDYDVRTGFAAASFATGSLINDDLMEFVTTSFMRLSTGAFIEYMEDLALADDREAVKKLDVPLLYAKGGKSAFYITESCDWIRDNINPDQEVTIEVFEESGHFIPFEEANKFNTVLANFVKRVNKID